MSEEGRLIMYYRRKESIYNSLKNSFGMNDPTDCSEINLIIY